MCNIVDYTLIISDLLNFDYYSQLVRLTHLVKVIFELIVIEQL